MITLSDIKLDISISLMLNTKSKYYNVIQLLDYCFEDIKYHCLTKINNKFIYYLNKSKFKDKLYVDVDNVIPKFFYLGITDRADIRCIIKEYLNDCDNIIDIVFVDISSNFNSRYYVSRHLTKEKLIYTV